MTASSKYKGLLLIILLVAVFPFFALCFFVHPSADDYSMVWLVKSSGYWQYQRDMYQLWTGRFTANLIEGLHPMRIGALAIYRLIPFAVLLLLYHSLLMLVKTVCSKTVSLLNTHLYTLIFFATYLNIFPSTAEGIYWFPGAVEYTLAGILSIYVVVLLFRAADTSARFRWLNLIPASLAAIAVGGLNEISMALLAALLFAALLYFRIRNKRNDFSLLLIFVLLIVAGTVDISAPGNFNRMSVFSDTMNVPASLIISLKGLVKVLGIHFQSPLFILVSILFFFSAGEIIRKPEVSKRIPAFHPVYTIACTVLLVFALYLPGALGMGVDPPMRVHATISLAFMVLWFFNLAVLIRFLQTKNIQIPELHSMIQRVMISAAILLTLLDFTKIPDGPYVVRGNIARAGYDLFFKAPAYNREFNERYDYIRQRKFYGEKNVKVKGISSIPGTIFFIDIENKAGDWKNTDYARFFDVDSICTDKEIKTKYR